MSVFDALRGLARAGLYVDERSPSPIPQLSYERAVMRVAATQVRAITIALQRGEEGEGEFTDWFSLDEFTASDAATALAGVHALLRHSPELIDRVRVEDEREAPEAEEAAAESEQRKAGAR